MRPLAKSLLPLLVIMTISLGVSADLGTYPFPQEACLQPLVFFLKVYCPPKFKCNMPTGKLLGQSWNPDRSQCHRTSSIPSLCSSEAMQYRKKVYSVHCENENVPLVKTCGEYRSELSSMLLCVLEKQLLHAKTTLPGSKGWENRKRFLSDFTLNRHVHVILSYKEISVSTQSSALQDLVGAGRASCTWVDGAPAADNEVAALFPFNEGGKENLVK